MIPKRECLQGELNNGYVEEYFTILEKKKASLVLKRAFDIVMGVFMTIVLSPIMLAVAIAIKIDSKGPVFYRQERVTQYGRVFKVFKFRTMVIDADKIGSHVTVNNDPRITRIGKKIRGSRLDELPQLFNVITGDMTFVGTRPEAVKYVKEYTDEMRATLLLPAGITSRASITYKDEAELLSGAENPDDVYVNIVLPEKMKINLEYLESFTIWEDIRIMFETVKSVLT